MAESPQFLNPIANRGQGLWWWRQMLDRK